MNKPQLLAFTVAAALAAGTPAIAQEIVVSSESATSEISQNLEHQLDSVARGLRQSYGDGYAIVRFQRGADGRPANVSFYRRSGDFGVDRMARLAVRRLGAQGGLPHTGTADQRYQANIVLANSETGYRQVAAQLARAEAMRLASSTAEREVLALSAGVTRKTS